MATLLAATVLFASHAPGPASGVRASLDTDTLTVGRGLPIGECSRQALSALLLVQPTSAAAACAVCADGSRVADLLVDPADVRSIARPLADLLGAGADTVTGAAVTIHACRPPRAPPSAELAVLVPTIPEHVRVYAALVQSLATHLPAPGGTAAPWDLLSVHSSVRELVEVARIAHGSHDLARVLPPGSVFRSLPRDAVRFLVFDPAVQPRLRERWTFKYTFQSLKKIWAWTHVRHELALVLDSDFQILRPVDVRAVARALAYVVPLTNVEAAATRRFHNVLHYVNEVLPEQMRLGWDYPFELPWVIVRPAAAELHRVLGDAAERESAGSSRDYVAQWLSVPSAVAKPRALFEILLYRAVLLHAFSANVTRLPLDQALFRPPSSTLSRQPCNASFRRGVYAALPDALGADGGVGYGVTTAAVLCAAASCIDMTSSRRLHRKPAHLDNGRPWLLMEVNMDRKGRLRPEQEVQPVPAAGNASSDLSSRQTPLLTPMAPAAAAGRRYGSPAASLTSWPLACAAQWQGAWACRSYAQTLGIDLVARPSRPPLRAPL